MNNCFRRLPKTIQFLWRFQYPLKTSAPFLRQHPTLKLFLSARPSRNTPFNIDSFLFFFNIVPPLKNKKLSYLIIASITS